MRNRQTCDEAALQRAKVSSFVEERVLDGMQKCGYSERFLDVVRLCWEYENIPIDKRTPEVRLDFGRRMLEANGRSFVLEYDHPTPEPLEQLRLAVMEAGPRRPHVFFPGKDAKRTLGKAYAVDIRDRILGLATALVWRLAEERWLDRKEAIEQVACLMRRSGFASASGGTVKGVEGLTKHCRATSRGEARFQVHYDFARKYKASGDPERPYEAIEALAGALEMLCVDWRLISVSPPDIPSDFSS